MTNVAAKGKNLGKFFTNVRWIRPGSISSFKWFMQVRNHIVDIFVVFVIQNFTVGNFSYCLELLVTNYGVVTMLVSNWGFSVNFDNKVSKQSDGFFRCSTKTQRPPTVSPIFIVTHVCVLRSEKVLLYFSICIICGTSWLARSLSGNIILYPLTWWILFDVYIRRGRLLYHNVRKIKLILDLMYQSLFHFIVRSLISTSWIISTVCFALRYSTCFRHQF